MVDGRWSMVDGRWFVLIGVGPRACLCRNWGCRYTHDSAHSSGVWLAYTYLSPCLLLLIHDAWFYVTHRALHRSKLAFKYIHWLHHERVDPEVRQKKKLQKNSRFFVCFGPFLTPLFCFEQALHRPTRAGVLCPHRARGHGC